MKKTYTKPQIAYENFLLNSNIAYNTCDEPYVTTPQRDTCGIQGSNAWDILFSLDVSGSNCTAPGADDTKNSEGMCYHNPSASFNMFNS